MWLFVPELFSRSAPDTAASSAPSELLAPEFALWVLSSGKPTRLPSSQVEWSKVPWIHVLSSTIWNPSMAARTAAAWISSLVESHVRGQASPASARATTTSAGSGPSSGRSSATAKRRASSSKTFPDSSRLTVDERSRRSSGTWARAGGLRSGTVSPRQPSAPRTSAIVSSCSLPTPTASEYGSSHETVMLPTPASTECAANGDAERTGSKGGKTPRARKQRSPGPCGAPDASRRWWEGLIKGLCGCRSVTMVSARRTPAAIRSYGPTGLTEAAADDDDRRAATEPVTDRDRTAGRARAATDPRTETWTGKESGTQRGRDPDRRRGARARHDHAIRLVDMSTLRSCKVVGCETDYLNIIIVFC